MQKLEEKVEDWDSSLSAQDRSNAFPRLAWIRSTKKPKGTLSVKAHAKHEVTWKLSYLRPIKGVRSKGERHQSLHTKTHSSLMNTS